MCEQANNEISLKIKLEYDDYKRYCRYSNRINSRRANIITYLLITFIVVTSAWKHINKPDFIPFTILYLISVIFIFVAIRLVYSMVNYGKIKKYYQSNKTIQYENIYTISDVGIRFKSDVNEGILKWVDTYKVVEDKTAFYIYESPISAEILLKRAFNNDSEMHLFKETIENNLDKSKIKFKKVK